MPFSRHSRLLRRHGPRPGHHPGRGRLHLGRPGQALPRRPRRAVRRAGGPRPHRDRRRDGQAGRGARLLPDLVLRPPARHRARRAARQLRARRPQPRLLHDRRRRGRRDGLEAGQAVLQADREADQVQGHQPVDRLPRHAAGRPVDHRHPGGQDPLRAPRAGRHQGPEHQLLPGARGVQARREGLRHLGRRTASPRRSSSRAPRASPPSSSSRSRTPAAASRRRPATSSACGRSATSTT